MPENPLQSDELAADGLPLWIGREQRFRWDNADVVVAAGSHPVGRYLDTHAASTKGVHVAAKFYEHGDDADQERRLLNELIDIPLVADVAGFVPLGPGEGTWLFTKWAAGGPLVLRVPFDPPAAERHLRYLLDLLPSIHQEGIAVDDVALENLLLSGHGEQAMLLIADLDHATEADGVSEGLGRYHYRPVSPRTARKRDYYAAGLVFFEMLTGKRVASLVDPNTGHQARALRSAVLDAARTDIEDARHRRALAGMLDDDADRQFMSQEALAILDDRATTGLSTPGRVPHADDDIREPRPDDADEEASPARNGPADGSRRLRRRPSVGGVRLLIAAAFIGAGLLVSQLVGPTTGGDPTTTTTTSTAAATSRQTGPAERAKLKRTATSITQRSATSDLRRLVRVKGSASVASTCSAANTLPSEAKARVHCSMNGFPLALTRFGSLTALKKYYAKRKSRADPFTVSPTSGTGDDCTSPTVSWYLGERTNTLGQLAFRKKDGRAVAYWTQYKPHLFGELRGRPSRGYELCTALWHLLL